MDLVTLELVQEYLVSTVREMRVTMIRTAHSSIIYEGHDFSCALLDAEGNLVAQSEDSPAHVIPLNWQVRQAKEFFAVDLHEGDIILVNDPYTSGTHLNDMAMIMPYFVDGQLHAFAVTRAHWGDVGGMTPGSISGKASEIFQEGLRVPFVKVYDRGRPVDGVLRLIFANVRGVEEREGDFHGMMACCGTALRRLKELETRFGDEVVLGSLRAVIDRSEQRMKKALRAIPVGIYRYEDYLDSDNSTGRPVLIKLSITARGEELLVDFSGTSRQVPAPINASLAVTAVGVFAALKSLLDPAGPINQGIFRPVEVRAPKGTILNVQPPGAVGGFSEIRRRVASTVMGALANAVPKYIAGDVKGTSNHTYIGSIDPRTGRHTIFYEYPAGGTGGFVEHDGNHTLRGYDEGDFASIQPVEAVEIEHALLVEKCELRTGSCGDGTKRGGLGMRREIRLLAEEGRFSELSDRNIIPPFGVYGGQAGAPNRFFVRRNGKVVEPSDVPGKISGFPLIRNDIVVLESAGGGGYGDPLDRDPLAVAADVREEYITVQHAQEKYGVVIDADTVNTAETMAARDRLKHGRTYLTVGCGEESCFENGMRVSLLAPTDAERFGGNGALIELVNPNGAPLRSWIKVSSEMHSGEIRLDVEGCQILGVTIGGQLEVRRLTAPRPTDASSDSRHPVN